MEFELCQKENGFAGNVKRLKTNLLKWFVKKKKWQNMSRIKISFLERKKKLIAFISEM